MVTDLVVIPEMDLRVLRTTRGRRMKVWPATVNTDLDGLKYSTSSLLSIVKTRLVPALSVHAVLIGAFQCEPFDAERGSMTVMSFSSIRGDARRRLLKGLVAG
jgi:hypothetical protein